MAAEKMKAAGSTSQEDPMHRLTAIVAATLASIATAADAGDLRAPEQAAAPVGCVPSADDTVWLPAPGATVSSLSGDAGYGKSCDGARDPRWITELVAVRGAAFRVRATSSDGSDAPVALDVYGWVTPHWEYQTYVPGHWRSLGRSRGPGVTALGVAAATGSPPYAVVRIAARAGGGAERDVSRNVAVTVSR
jgi:hypothetical protein